MKPPRTWSSVLLPHPLGPTTVTNSPSATARCARWSTSRVWPSRAYDLRSPTTSRAGAPTSGPRLVPRRPGQEPLEPGLCPLRRPALALDPAISEPARQYAAQLALFADLPREAHDRLDALLAALGVPPQGRVDVRPAARRLRELVGEHDGVLHRHPRALAHVRRQRVRGVAQERDAAPGPGRLLDLLDVRAHDPVGRAQRRERAAYPRVAEVGEESPQRGRALERPGPAPPRRVERRPHVELAAADRNEADSPTAPEKLDEGRQAVMVGYDESMGAIAEVGGLGRPEEPCPHARADPVGADQDVAGEDLAAIDLDPDASRAGVEGDDARVEADGLGGQAVVQALLQMSAMEQCADGEAPVGVERPVIACRQGPPAMIERLARQIRRAPRADARRQAVGLQHAHGVGIHDDPRADRREPGGALQHDDGKPHER